LGHAFSSVGKGVVGAVKKVGDTVTKIPIVGDVVKGGVGLAKKAVGVAIGGANNALDTTASISKGVAGTAGVLSTAVPQITKGLGQDAVAITKEAPSIIHDVTRVAGGVATGVEGIGSIASYLPFLALGGFGLYVMNSSKSR
jgi:hypothetical protein